MTKAKTNALDSLRTLIAERQQYDQWISTLESKRDGTPEHVFNRVYSDYRSRLDRVLGEIRSHSEELQLSIAALSTRLTEVSKDEEAKRDSIQEAELRAAVGEYDASQWESLRNEAGHQLERIAADRASLEGQLAELESIKKLSEVTTTPETSAATTSQASVPSPATSTQAPPPYSAPAVQPAAAKAAVAPPAEPAPPQAAAAPRETPASKESVSAAERRFSDAGWPARDIVDIPQKSAPAAATPAVAPQPAARTVDPAAANPRPTASPAPPPPAQSPPPKRRTPAGKDAQIATGFSKPVPTPAEGRPEVNKTLKCPECGTANYPTEWYCERCGGELATM